MLRLVEGALVLIELVIDGRQLKLGPLPCRLVVCVGQDAEAILINRLLLEVLLDGRCGEG